MKNRIDPRGVVVALAALASAACASETSDSVPATAPVIAPLSYRYSGAVGLADVTREQTPGGFEMLTGTFLSAARADRSPEARLLERVSIDGQGQLVRAEIAIERAGTLRVFTLDRQRGTVRIERTGTRSLDWAVPRDAPWVYTPAAAGGAIPTMTPISSWVAVRAGAGTATVVRVLEPEHQTSYLTTIDQVAVPTERGTTVSLGYDAADADAGRFITELRLSGGPLTLSLGESPERIAVAEPGVPLRW